MVGCHNDSIMQNNNINFKVTDKLSFLTHSFFTNKINDSLVEVDVCINDDVYLEMQLSSRYYAPNTSLHERNVESLSGMVSTVFGIEPNPNFIFKGEPIENERYLIHRYIKSIFQIPHSNLYCFDNDNKYKSFCSTYNLEYEQQKWFKRIYISDDYNNAIEYLTKNSLVFQELYFPSDKRVEFFKPTLHDVSVLQRDYNFKDDFMQIFNVLKINNVKLYHFTDKKNIESIKKYGLLSEDAINQCRFNPKYASSQESRLIDKKMGLSDYVRLSFVKNHPMMYTSMMVYNLNPVILEVNPLIALMPNVFFSDRNTLKYGANIGPGASDLSKVNFSVINSGVAYYNLPNIESKNSYQAEVLVKNRIGPEFILNINTL